MPTNNLNRLDKRALRAQVAEVAKDLANVENWFDKVIAELPKKYNTASMAFKVKNVKQGVSSDEMITKAILKVVADNQNLTK